MECRNCGYKLEKNQNVCPRCGESFDWKKYEKEKTATILGSSVAAAGASAALINEIRKGAETVNAEELGSSATGAVKEVLDENSKNELITKYLEIAKNALLDAKTELLK